MASVFSYYAASLHFSRDREDQLTQSPGAIHCLHFLHHILDPSSTIPLTRLLIATIVNPHIRNAPLHGTAANDADVSTRKPRRFL
jgi:hypothetical protein